MACATGEGRGDGSTLGEGVGVSIGLGKGVGVTSGVGTGATVGAGEGLLSDGFVGFLSPHLKNMSTRIRSGISFSIPEE